MQHVFPAQNQLPDSADDCGGLGKDVKLMRSARVMLRRNIDTNDYLVNGAVGTITVFEWPEGQSENTNVMPSAVYMQFDNARVGNHWHTAEGMSGHSVARVMPSVALFKHVGEAWQRKRKAWQRKQFPFAWAWAMIIPKVQGLSIERAVVMMLYI